MQQFLHAFAYLRKGVLFLFARHKHQVVTFLYFGHKHRRRSLHLTAYSVSAYCVSVLFAYGKACLRQFFVVFAVQQHKVFVGYALRMLVDVVVLIVLFKPVNRLQVSAPKSGGKRMTTLVSSSCKRSSAAGCLHSCTESVNFASLSFLGLIGSFHFGSPYFCTKNCAL